MEDIQSSTPNPTLDQQFSPEQATLAPQTKKSMSSRTVLLAAGLLFLLGIVGGGGYYLGTQQKTATSIVEVSTPSPSPVTTSVTQQTTLVDDNGWQSYTDELEGYQFKFASNHILTYLPVGEEGHRYGVFESQESSDQCLEDLPQLSEECSKAYYFIVVSSSTEGPVDTINSEEYIDAKGREWSLSRTETEDTVRIESYLKQDNSWQKVVVEGPLLQKEYPAFLNEMTEVAKQTLSSFENRL